MRRRSAPVTRAVVVVHYAGMGCDMGAIRSLADAHRLLLIEDAAHGLGASYHGEWLGSFGDFAAFSFHETKNITCGQGGMLVVNNKRFAEQAAIHWENGTNRAAFFRGEVNQYTWVDRGGCYTLGDMAAAYLFAQLQDRDAILDQRNRLWNRYNAALQPLARPGRIELPQVPAGAIGNGHIFYLRLADRATRDRFIADLAAVGVMAVFHYVPLHSSPHHLPEYNGPDLPHCQAWSDRLVRLPIYHSMTDEVQDRVIAAVFQALGGRS
ncbi:MAG: DegT/DnrJ/EryC1/StrS family aminotransferase [Bacteroidia bacterium]